MRAVISTNGTLITQEISQRAKDAGVSYIGVSIDGLEEVHDKFRGKRGAFKETLRGIRYCRETGVKVGLRFTLTRYNMGEVGKVFDLLEEENIPRLCIYHLAYAGRGSHIVKEDLAPGETRQVVDLIFERTQDLHRRGPAKEVRTVDNHADAVYLYLKVKQEQPERAEEVYRLLQWNGGNNSGIAIADIDNLGNVHADQFWQHYSFGNVRERKFSEIWRDTSDSLMAGLKYRKTLLKGRGARCQFLEICNGNLRGGGEGGYD